MNLLKRFLLYFCLCLLPAVPAVPAQDRFDSWSNEDGLPQNSVLTILSTRDGYLWAGTYEGLARFDGVNFSVFDNTNSPEFKSNWISSLAEDRAGNLWIGVYGGGLFRRDGGRFTVYAEAEGLPTNRVRAVLADDGDNIWIGTEKGLSCLRDGKLTTLTVRDGLPGDAVWSLAADDAGALWIGTDGGLARLKDGKLTIYKQSDGLTSSVVRTLFWSQKTGLWIGTGKGLNRWQDNRFVEFAAKSESADYDIRAVAEDRAGALWIATFNHGLRRIENIETTAKSEMIKNLPDNRFLAVYSDSEGTIWSGGGETGLYRLQENRFQTFAREQGVQEDSIITVYEDRRRNLWFSTEQSLYRLSDGKLKIYPQTGNFRGVIFAMTEDGDGNLWIGGTARGIIWRLRDDRFTALTTADGLPNSYTAAIIGDREGKIWVATGDGQAIFQNGRFTVLRKSDGLVSDLTNALHEARDGSIWIGTANGISRYQNGRFTNNWTTADGLSSDAILSFYEADDGGLWIGSNEGGLTRYKNGVFSTVSSRHGLYDNLAFQILESNGDLWMSGNKGIYRASLRELNDVADGKISAVTSYSYGRTDGMISRECNGSSRAGWKTHDGNLWFPTVKGLVSIDPKNLAAPPPQILLEKIKVDEQVFSPDEPLQLTPAQENLEISYTAISWHRPRQIRFKYRLENLDRDWTEAGTRRTAYYTHLPPGEYTFRVIADNGDGVWNLEGKSLRIKVYPPFYRTWWFLLLGVLAISAIVYSIYKYRIGLLEKRNEQQKMFSRQIIQSQEQERTRIAANLHDSLGQQLLVIKNWAMLELAMNADQNQPHEALNEISDTASQAIDEVREIIYDLRPYQLDKIGLTKTIKYMVEKVAAASNIEFTIEIDEIDNLFDYDSEITLYRIVQECLNNILKHSGAKRASVVIKKQDSRINLTIEDDGRGFTPESIGTKLKGGSGLTGIGERVRMLGGTQTISSAADSGTKIIISITLEENE